MSVSNPPPYASYGILSGQLFLYGQGRAAFESPVPQPNQPLSTKKCILIGGLSDGLLPVPYTQALESACIANDWSLVQPILSSSYLGFGNGSLSRDVQEIEELMNYLIDYREAKEFCLVGHSTGCQDAVHFLKEAKSELIQTLRVVALQAPVSDREGAMQEPNYESNLDHAKEMLAINKEDEMMPRSAFWAPITAQRFVDLFDKDGADDYFSSDYTDEKLQERLEHVGQRRSINPKLKVLVAFSGADEYVPPHVDKSALTDRLVTAMNSGHGNDVEPVAERLYIDTGNHNLKEGPNDGQIFVNIFAELLEKM